MNEAETRAEHIDPALKAAGWGVVEGSRIRREYLIYDQLGQVTGGKKYWSDGSVVAGQQFEYTFDDIGNRTATKAGGDQYGGNLRTARWLKNEVRSTLRKSPAISRTSSSADILTSLAT